MYMFGKDDIIGCGFLTGHKWREDSTTVSVEDKEIIGEIKIFPNPIQLGATATIMLDIEQQGMYQFSVYDTRCELVDQHQEFLHISENRIDYTPEHLPTGMYYIQIEGVGGMTTVKLVVELVQIIKYYFMKILTISILLLFYISIGVQAK
jgi:Secretion system C-terminal sorting domain